jgi:hypothetical protein
MTDVLQIPIDEAARKKIESNELKYPVEIAKGSAEKYSRRHP